MRIGVVIVTHESSSRIGALLEGLRRFEPEARVLVVDSGSPDGAPSLDGTDVVALGTNAGYGAACNEGVRRLVQDGQWDAFALLNPDVRLLGPSLTEVGRGMLERPRLGIATGPVVDGSGRRQPSAWGPTSAIRAFWFATGWQFPRLRRLVGTIGSRGTATSAATLVRDDLVVDGHVLGGAMVVRPSCWEQLGGFDEDFFLYWEDADLCERARRSGWEVRLLPCTPFVHEAGTSSEGVLPSQRWAWYVEGASRFADKHLSVARRRALLVALRVGRVLGRAHS